MAKKAVATLREGTSDGRAYTKVIKMVRSEKTGAYIFDERMVPNEAVRTFSRSKILKYNIDKSVEHFVRHSFFMPWRLVFDKFCVCCFVCFM